MITIRYFAWLREKVGFGEERVELPTQIVTIADLIGWLKQRSPEHAEALAQPNTVRAAIDQQHVTSTAPIAGAREIALFPPVTGG